MRHVREDHTVHARCLEIRDELLKAVVMHHVDVAHTDERNLRVFPNLLDDFECLRHRHAVPKGDDARLLNDRTIRHRVREGKPQLNHIRARLLGTAHDVHGRLCTRAARCDVDIKSCATFCAQFCEFFIQTRAHAISSPSSFATICTSLSPRPERQTTMFSPALVSGMSFSRYASACELSSAGMMPSMRERR